MVWYGMVWYGMVWYGMVWYGMVWYGMVWYGMVWYGRYRIEIETPLIEWRFYSAKTENLTRDFIDRESSWSYNPIAWNCL